MLNIDNVGDFLVMAATLAQIKSRLLFPSHGDSEDEEEDPRLELIRPLSEYMQIKTAAEELAQRNLLGDRIFARRINPKEYFSTEDAESVQVGLFELIDAFQKILLESIQRAYRRSVRRSDISQRPHECHHCIPGSARFHSLFRFIFWNADKNEYYHYLFGSSGIDEIKPGPCRPKHR